MLHDKSMKKLSLDEQTVILNYKYFKSGPKTAKHFKCSTVPIYRILRKHKIPRKTQSECARKYTLNHNYFNKINTEDKAYFLGLICSDGYIYTKWNVLEIQLQERDNYILKKLSFLINSNRPLQFINKSKYNYKHQNAYRFSINSPIIVNNMKKMGIYQGKSLTLKPKMLNFIPKKFIRHFVRGYFDGDGGFFNYIGIVATYEICKAFQKFFIKHGIITYIRKPKKHSKSNTFEIFTAAKGNILNLYQLLYQKSHFFLTRKRNKIENFLKRKNLIY